MWNDYYENDGRPRDDRRMEDAMVRREEYDATLEELGEALVANQVLQAEVEAWKHTSARCLQVLTALVADAPKNGEALLKAAALLRELGVHPDLPSEERSREFATLLRNIAKS